MINIDINKELFLNSFYDDENDTLGIIMKDVDSGEKTCFKKVEPKIPIWIAKQKQKYYNEFMHVDDLVKREVKYKWREYEVAKALNITNFSTLVRNKSLRRKDILLNKDVYGSDINIQNYHLMQYLDAFPYTEDENKCRVHKDVPPIRNIHKSFFDIETDIAVSTERSEQPIYMITYVDNKLKKAVTSILWNDNYKGIEKFNNQDFIKDNLRKRMYEEIEVIDVKNKQKKEMIQKRCKEILDAMDFKIMIFHDERNLLLSTMQYIIREVKPDFLEIFNAEYDIGQIMMRAEVLGIPLTELFCCEDIGSYIDFDFSDKTFNPAKRKHRYNSASYTKIYDSMILYYAIRKTKGFSSFNLSDTAYREIGFRKLSFSHVCNHIIDLPYADFELTYQYNVMDVMLMYYMEEILLDIDYMISMRFLKRTEYDNIWGPMASITNVFWHVATRHNKIFGPNINKILIGMGEPFKEMLRMSGDTLTLTLHKLLNAKYKVEGGLCSDPTKFISTHGKSMLSILNTKINKYFIDIDATSMYPMAMISSVISKSSLFGRITKVGDTNIKKDDGYEVMLPIINRDVIKMCEVYFGMMDEVSLLNELGYSNKDTDIVKTFRCDLNTFKDTYVNKNKKLYTELSKLLKNVISPKIKSSKKNKKTSEEVFDEDENDLILNEVESNINSLWYLPIDADKTRIGYLGTAVYYNMYDKMNNKINNILEYFNVDTSEMGNSTLFIDNKEKLISNTSDFISTKKDVDIRETIVENMNINEYTKTLFDKNNLECTEIIIKDNIKLRLNSRLTIFNRKTHNMNVAKRKAVLSGSMNLSILQGGSLTISTKDNINSELIKTTPNLNISVVDNKFTIHNITSDKLVYDSVNDKYVLLVHYKEDVLTINMEFDDITLDVYRLDTPEDIYMGKIRYIKTVEKHKVEVMQNMIFVS